MGIDWLQSAREWEQRAKTAQSEADYYQAELAKAHTLLGRVIHQLSERWDTVNLTKYYPTDNLHRFRTVGNPTGSRPQDAEQEAK